MNSSSHLLVHESSQMIVLNIDLGGPIFTEGGHYSPVNNVLGGQYSPVSNVQGDILGGGALYPVGRGMHPLPLKWFHQPPKSYQALQQYR